MDSPFKTFWQYSVEEWFKNLNSSESGLDNDFASIRLENKFEHRFNFGHSWKNFIVFISKFKNPIDLLLVVVLIFSFYMGHYRDLIIILLVMILSVAIRYLQEVKARKVIRKLHSLVVLKCRVVRSGVEIVIPRNQIVAGDIIKFRAGDMIPCDCLVVESSALFTDESSLDGVTFPIRKFPGILKVDTLLSKRTNCLWDGTSVVSGMCTALVINVGRHTLFGENSRNSKKTTTSVLDKGVVSFGYFIMKVAAIFSFVFFALSFLWERDFLTSFLFAIALSGGIAPDLLPAIETLSLSVGASRLIKKNILVKKLQDLQVLGEIDLLCTDKTGTLTEGESVVEDIVNYLGEVDPFTKELAIINARMESGYSNPIDRALRELTQDTPYPLNSDNVIGGIGIKRESLHVTPSIKVDSMDVLLPLIPITSESGNRDEGVGGGAVRKSSEIPYDFVRKRISVSVLFPFANEGVPPMEVSGGVVGLAATTPSSRLNLILPSRAATPSLAKGNMMITKGSFKQILEICTTVRITDGQLEPISSHLDSINKLFEKYGEEGKRVVAVCYKQIKNDTLSIEDEVDMIFSGLVVISDPVKSGLMEIFADLKSLAVGHKIITGDSKFNALKIAGEVGMFNPILATGKELSQLSLENLILRVKEVDIFAEIEPQQKEEIVDALQKSYTVGYLGNGINDVSVMKTADVAISVMNSQEVVKDAADFVLLQDDLSLISQGIREGRKAFINSLKYIFIRIGSNFGSMASIGIGWFLFPFAPLMPAQLFLINFLTDIPYLSISSDYVYDEDINLQDKWDIGMVRKFMLRFGLFNCLYNLITFGILSLFVRFSEIQFQSSWFIQIALCELFVVFIIRTKYSVFKSRPSLHLIILGLLSFFGITLLAYTPIAGYFSIHRIPFSIFIYILISIILYCFLTEKLKNWFLR